MSVVAKMTCHKAEKHENYVSVMLSAVYDPDPASPNHEWSAATPSGRVEMTITNMAAAGQFEQGKTYLVKFEEA